MDDIAEDALDIAGPSGGNIEGGGVSGLGKGTVLQDLREAYLEGKYGDTRDAQAARFDEQLLALLAMPAAA